jgi:hypothetical protein
MFCAEGYLLVSLSSSDPVFEVSIDSELVAFPQGFKRSQISATMRYAFSSVRSVPEGGTSMIQRRGS